MPETLKLGFVSREAADRACKLWHYSKKCPGLTGVYVGVWESGKFIGVVIYGMGAAPNIARPFGVARTEIAELVRVALDKHVTPVSRIIAISMRLLRGHCPGLRILVSFADSAQGHHGGIYQAGGWTFTGSSKYHVYRINGEDVHPKSMHSRYGIGGQSISWLRKNVDPKAERIETPEKHKYVFVLDPNLRPLVDSMAKPYPKR